MSFRAGLGQFHAGFSKYGSRFRLDVIFSGHSGRVRLDAIDNISFDHHLCLHTEAARCCDEADLSRIQHAA
jgi:hypothetical protein